MSKSVLLKNTLIYSIGEIFPKLISFVLLPVFTLYLSTSDYGIISYTNSVMFFLFVLSSLSLNTYLLRVYFDCETEVERKRTIGSVFFTIFAVNILILALGYLFGPKIIEYTELQVPFYPYFSILLLNNFCEALSIIPLVIYRVQEKALYFVVVNVSRALLLFVVTYVLIVHLDWGLLGNFYGRLFVNVAFVIVYFYVILKYSTINIDFKAIKKSLIFSLPLIPGAIGYLLMSMSDRIILERYVSLSQIGIYSVAYTIAYSLSVVVHSGYRAFEPEIYKKFNTPDFNPFVNNIHKVFMYTVFVFALVITIFSRDILILMTKGEFVKGFVLIPIILVGVIATAQNAILVSIAISEKNTRLSGFSTVIGGTASIAFNLIFIPTYGIYAAALASAIAYVIMNVIVCTRMTYRTQVIKSDLFAFLYFITVSTLVVWLFGDDGVNFLSLFYKSGILAISVVVLFFIYRFNKNIIVQLFNLVRKKLA